MIKMAGATIDHLIAVTTFLTAFFIFISLYSQTLQTAIIYQRHHQLAIKCSDLLDNILLNPGYPPYWGQQNSTPTSFGLQDPESPQYVLSPFSIMRLRSSTGEPVYYPKTELWYSNITMGFGNFLLVPYTEVINYSTVLGLLGINGSYGFQLTITPLIVVSISEVQPTNPLTLAVNVSGKGFPLANAIVNYCFLTVSTGGGSYPYYTIEYGTALTDEKGVVLLNFTDVNGLADSYALIVYARLSGLLGVGYYEHIIHDENYVVPFIGDLERREVIIAHSYDVHSGDAPAEISFNATFVILTNNFTLREIPLENSTGRINYGEGKPYKKITIPSYNPGILIITYRKSAVETGVILMPWGLSSMAFPVTFGGDPSNQEWVATDIRNVIVNDIPYQVKLALWDLRGFSIVGGW
jgi:hypothetical protein